MPKKYQKIATFTDAENSFILQSSFAKMYFETKEKTIKADALLKIEKAMKRAGFSRDNFEIESRLKNAEQQYRKALS